MGSNISTTHSILSDATVAFPSETPFNADFDGDQQNVNNYDLENVKRYEPIQKQEPNLVG